MKPPDKAQFHYSDTEIAERLRWPGGKFVGDACAGCGRTANLFCYISTWQCVCGHLNAMRPRQDPHQNPDLGPSLDRIKQCSHPRN